MMIVGVAVVEIHVHDSQSLKAKRGVVRSIAGRLRNRFNVSVGEVGGQGTWQRATIGMSITGSDAGIVRKSLQQAIDFVEEMHLAQVIDSDLDILRMPLSGDDERPLATPGSDPGVDDGSKDENDRDTDEPWGSNLSGSRE